MSIRYYAASRATLIGLLLLASAAGASSIRRAELPAMLAGSELIVQARVSGLREDTSKAASGKLYTFVSLEIEDVLKGSVAPGERIELRYLGGEVNGRRMVVSDMNIPPLGERGVYFIKTREPRYLHPLYGWEQGHFLVINDPMGGEQRVRTAHGALVHGLGVEQTGARTPGLSRGVAAGVLTTPSALGQAPMTLGGFKSTLRSMLGEGQ